MPGLPRQAWRSIAAAGAVLLVLAAAPSAFAAGACVARPESGGIGGTGAPIASGGIGGTGAPEAGSDTVALPGGIGGTGAPESGGIGGTGARADAGGGTGGTGIVGTITGFASVCVNGLEVHYEPGTPTSVNGMPAHAERLAIGHVVAIDAVPSARGLEARSIAIMHAAAGPVTRIDTANGVIQVMGQTVRTDASAAAAAGLRTGDVVNVSGLRTARGELVASRIDAASAGSEASLIGELTGPAASRPIVHGTRVVLPSAEPGTALRGREVLIRGRWDGARLQAERVEPAASGAVIQRAENFSVEGFVRRAGDRLQVGGLPIQVDGRARAPAQGERVIASGRFTADRRAIVDRVEAARDRGDRGRTGASSERGRSGRSDESDSSGRGIDGSSGGNRDDGSRSGSGDRGSNSSGDRGGGRGGDRGGSSGRGGR